MNDSIIINGSNSLIYAICLYDTEKNKIAAFQVRFNYFYKNKISF
jgi:hypothetical protein